MTDKPGDLVSALRELDACNQTIKAMREEMAELRDLLKQTTISLDLAMAPKLGAAPPKRGRGRPKKVIDDSWMLDEFPKMKAEFIAANKFKKPTDKAVLNWHFEQLFERHGLRVSKVRSPDFQAKLKRFLNRLGDVRNPIRKLPIK